MLLALTPLPGPLPPSWGDLCCITEIDLQQNYMTGGLPDSWGKLTQLQILRLDLNRQVQIDQTATGLRGTVPAAWKGMTELRTLLLGTNALSGTFPAAEFNALTKLTYMTVDSNPQLSGFLPGSFRQRVFNMAYVIDIDVVTGDPVRRGPDNYGLGGGVIYTASGPLWRTQITNWEGLPDNSATNPNPQPRPDPCAAIPPAAVC